MTDITELAQREKFEAWFKSSFHPDKTGPYIKDQLYFAWKAAGAEMVEALEKAQSKNALVAGGIEATAKLHERIAELDAELEREREKSRRVMSRIAELESRTVKLPEPYAYLRDNDGQIQISIGAERPSDRSGGYANPWFAIYTATGIKVEAE
ncbi:hypothetical protein ABU996_12910 [Klebsiella variicola]|uniref:hypothetical protein n=1 Tax=Klebsiella variicola TaxID=244366 RepID=UPI00336BDF7C